jgi:hypothetical protein
MVTTRSRSLAEILREFLRDFLDSLVLHFTSQEPLTQRQKKTRRQQNCVSYKTEMSRRKRDLSPSFPIVAEFRMNAELALLPSMRYHIVCEL